MQAAGKKRTETTSPWGFTLQNAAEVWLTIVSCVPFTVDFPRDMSLAMDILRLFGKPVGLSSVGYMLVKRQTKGLHPNRICLMAVITHWMADGGFARE